MTTDYLRRQGEEIVVALRVQPRASRTELGGALGAELKLRVAAPPVDDAANEEVLRFLARQMGCPRRQLRLLHGRTSRHKQIAVAGLTLDQVQARLQT